MSCEGSDIQDNVNNPTGFGGNGGGTGEANTALNVGSSGVGVYKTKSGVALHFKKVYSLSALLTIVDNLVENRIDFDLDLSSFSIVLGDNENYVSDAELIIIQNTSGVNTGDYVDTFLTTEFATNQKWIDSKIIYRKTINTGALPNSTTKNIAHGITNLETIIEITGAAQDGSINAIPLPYPNTTDTNSCSLAMDATNIILTSAVDLSGYTGSHVTIYYTLTGGSPP